MSNFRFPDGVEFLGGGDGGLVRFNVDIPIDDDGFFGRECPECEQHFRVSHVDYDSLPDDLRLWCTYCGHHDNHSEFMTQQQHDRVMRAASDYATQLLGQALDRSFGNMARQSRGSVFRITYRSKPFFPSPLPGIDEEKLVRVRQCGDCQLRYAVFGDHRFCPVCGLLPPLVTALDALAAESVRLDVLDELDPAVTAALRESGVLERTYVDTVENLVGIIEALAERVFRAAVPNADAVLKGKGNVFQRLDDLADLFATNLANDPRPVLGTDWAKLRRAWAARHVFTHCDGIVDARYFAAVPTSALRAGQRLRITEVESRSAIEVAERMCRALAA